MKEILQELGPSRSEDREQSSSKKQKLGGSEEPEMSGSEEFELLELSRPKEKEQSCSYDNNSG